MHIEYFIGEFPTYLDSFEAMNPTPNVTEFSLGGRLMPRSLVASNSSASSLTNALRYINDNGAVISGVSTNASRGASRASNSVNPAWRDALFDAVVGTYVSLSHLLRSLCLTTFNA